MSTETSRSRALRTPRVEFRLVAGREPDKSNRVRSLAHIAALFGETPHHAVGSWFLLGEDLLPIGGPAFSNHGKPRPVVVARPPGPNAIVHTCSTTGGQGEFHEPHQDHAAPPCCVTKAGHVLLRPAFAVPAAELTSERFACFEPAESPLLPMLRRGRP